MLKKIAHITIWVLVAVVIITSIGYTIITSKKVICRDVKVEIIDSSKIGFLRSSEIRKWILNNYASILNKPISALDLRKIEQGVSNFQAVASVEAFTTIFANGKPGQGALVARIKQREPVFRVDASGQDYYVDKDGKIINWSPRYTPRVLIVGGSVSPLMARKDLLPLINYINHDPFFSSQIDQIYSNSKGELTLIPRVGEQRIIFGKANDYTLKFRNLKALYTDGFSSGGWTKYKTINVEYRNQVVCTKK